MRNGNRVLRNVRRMPAGSERGFAYIGVLVLTAVIGIGLMQASLVWSKQRQRERETELLFVGSQIRLAIERYYRAPPGSQYPRSLDALVEDKRSPNIQHHLRRLYADPMTGKPDWGIVKAPDGGIMGVYSQAPGKPLKQGGFALADEAFSGKNSYRDWVFIYRPDNANGAARP